MNEESMNAGNRRDGHVGAVGEYLCADGQWKSCRIEIASEGYVAIEANGVQHRVPVAHTRNMTTHNHPPEYECTASCTESSRHPEDATGEWTHGEQYDEATGGLGYGVKTARRIVFTGAFAAKELCEDRNADVAALREQLARAHTSLLRIFDWAHRNRPYVEVSKIEGNTLLQDIAEQGLGYWPSIRDNKVVEEILSHRQQLAAAQAANEQVRAIISRRKSLANEGKGEMSFSEYDEIERLLLRGDS
jgi:hypothetical protein